MIRPILCSIYGRPREAYLITEKNFDELTAKCDSDHEDAYEELEVGDYLVCVPGSDYIDCYSVSAETFKREFLN